MAVCFKAKNRVESNGFYSPNEERNWTADQFVKDGPDHVTPVRILRRILEEHRAQLPIPLSTTTYMQLK